MLWIKEVEMVESVDDLKSSRSIRGTLGPDFWVARPENCFSTEQNHPEYPLQEKGQSGGNESSQRRPIPSRKTDCLLDLRILPGHRCQWVLSRIMPMCLQSLFEMTIFSGIRYKMGRNSIVLDENPIWWHLGKFVQIKNTRVCETQDRLGIVQFGDSSEESWNWLS